MLKQLRTAISSSTFKPLGESMRTLSLSDRARWWCVLTGVFAAVVATTLLASPEYFSSPVYRELTEIMPLTGWGLIWAVIAGLMTLAAITKRPLLRIVGTTLTIATGGCWTMGLAWSHWVTHNTISPTGLALWGYLVISQAFVISSPGQFRQ